MTQVQSADGVIHQFPDEASQAVIDRAMLDYARQGNAKRDAERRIKNTPDQVRAINKGASFGFMDEVDSAGAALETGAHNLFNKARGKPDVGYGMKDAYGAVMDANAKADNIYAKAHPIQNTALQIAGGAAGPGMAAGARYVGGARSLIGATGRSALVGAGVGTVSGAGNGRGVEGRAVGAAQGAAEGAVIGAALPAAGRLAQSAGRGLNAALGQPFGGAQRGAVVRLREALQQDGLTEQQIGQAVQNWQRSGVTPEFLNVVGENTRALIRAAGSQAGPARSAAQGYRNATVAGIPNRAIERTTTLTPGETRSPARYAEDTRTARRTDANTRYAGPNATPVEIDAEMASALRGQHGRDAISAARETAAANRDHAVLNELNQIPDGDLSSFPPVSARALDLIRMELRGAATRATKNDAGGLAAGLRGRMTSIDTGLDQVPGLTEARGLYRAQSQGIDAAEEGASVLGPRSEFQPEVEAQANNPYAVRGAQIRERQALRDKFGTRDQVRSILGDISDAPDVRPNLQQLYGEAGNNFADAAANLVQKQDHANFVAPNTGSQTFSRGNDHGNIFGTIRTAMEAMGGNLRPLLERAARGLTMTERERTILVQLGIGSPQEALRALAAQPAPAAQVGANIFRRIGQTAPNVAASQTSGN